MKTGALGGSFDPFHHGHLALALAARAGLGLDRIVVLPTATPPHKPGRRFAPAFARYAMTELALLDHPELVVSARELTPGQAAYTVETLAGLREEAPGDELFLLIGSDSLAELTTWRRWPELLELAVLAVLARPGAERAAIERGLPRELAARLAPGSVRWLEHPPHPASATEIRRRLSAGEAVPDDWLDPRVLTFVRKYRLYR